MWFAYLLIIVVALCLNGLLASMASDIAKEKGYKKRTWFHMCFWLCPISYVIVAAMPDRIMQEKVVTTNKLLEKLIDGQNAVPEIGTLVADEPGDATTVVYNHVKLGTYQQTHPVKTARQSNGWYLHVIAIRHYSLAVTDWMYSPITQALQESPGKHAPCVPG